MNSIVQYGVAAACWTGLALSLPAQAPPKTAPEKELKRLADELEKLEGQLRQAQQLPPPPPEANPPRRDGVFRLFNLRMFRDRRGNNPAEPGLIQRKSGEVVELAGRITAVADDLMSITLEVPGPDGQPVSSRQIHFTDKTQFSFERVEAGGKIPTVGYTAQVTLAAGSRDRAASVVLIGGKDSKP